MSTNEIDAPLLAKMFLAGARNLEAQKERINELNVFPVPDGDTGTNMTLTIMSAVREVSSLENLTLESFSKAVSAGSLRGARGNSGVILSQLLRGFTNVIRTETVVTPKVIVSSFEKAVETAYKAVMRPKEGTILTVAKGGAEFSASLLEENPDITFDELFPAIIERSEELLEDTPNLLPVLKEAGVVDSGGEGLIQILKGAYAAFNGEEIPANADSAESPDFESYHTVAESPDSSDHHTDAAAMQADIKYGYCTEFIIMLEKEFTVQMEQEFKEYLSSIGDSLVVVAGDDIVKVHVHTNDPGLAIQRGLTYGPLTRMKIDNMRQQHTERVVHEEERQKAAAEEQALKDAEKSEWKETGFISVSIGEGIADIFNDLGVDYIIEGGQTMNPSTEDMLNAINQVNAKNIFILPNNKNIIMTANQAKSMTKDKNIYVIPTTTLPQGITAVINYVPGKTPEENAEEMEKEALKVKTGQLTYAIRDTHIENKMISAGDIMSVGDQSILAVGKDVEPVAMETVEQMMEDDAELISIYYGEDMTEKEANAFGNRISELYPQCDVEVNYGGQPIYYYIISVE